MVIERATIEDAAEILALQKLAYISEAVPVYPTANVFTYPL